MLVVFIHGPAAAGKYTIGARLSEKMGLPLFHNHLTVDLAKTLFDFGTEGFVRLRADIWKRAFSEAAKAQRSFIFTFHPEATVDPALIHELVAIIERAGGQVCFIELRCSEPVILERLDTEGRRHFGKLTNGNLYQPDCKRRRVRFPSVAFPSDLY